MNGLRGKIIPENNLNIYEVEFLKLSMRYYQTHLEYLDIKCPSSIEANYFTESRRKAIDKIITKLDSMVKDELKMAREIGSPLTR